ncbi:hypothetical protein MSC32_16735 [Acinetobacter baumannii]|uniref:hypothetical protein n=1 Tax=Acinetobacter baumannii TaxID=470 RepID=UPI002342097C|nr:hypothetical protein [Acinetobacter baumannii]MDC5210388.1 hypothetical protein [Acinetobacter baumannii]MDC5234502.1 hypothetical protein [Acinetobacter baumannii]MDV4219304.1 hypothetical protein [Acinetobacter baumannii]
MNSKYEKLIVVVLWSVVAYAVALLTFCTFKNIYNLNADFISAFGSILGACAAIFAAVVAAYLFNDWKLEYRKNLEKEIIIRLIGIIEDLHFNFKPEIDILSEAVNSELRNITRAMKLDQIHYDETVRKKIKYLGKTTISTVSDSKDLDNLITNYLQAHEFLARQSFNYVNIFNVCKGYQAPEFPFVETYFKYFKEKINIDISTGHSILDKFSNYDTSFENLIDNLNNHLKSIK